MRPFHNVDEQEMFKRDINLHICRPAILVRTFTRPIWNLSCSQRWTQSDSKLQFPVPYRDAPRMRNSVLSSVSALYRDRGSVFGAFPCKTWDFQNPDSGFDIPYRNAIAIRNSFRVPGWPGPELNVQQAGAPLSIRGVSGRVFCGVLW